MRVGRLVFKDIGPFEEASFDFPDQPGRGELVLFEGPNGSGKTTIVQAIAAAVMCVFPSLPLTLQRKSFTSRLRSGVAEAHVVLQHASESIAVSCRENGASLDPAARSTAAARLLETFGATMGASAGISWAAFAFQGHSKTAELLAEGPKEISSSPSHGALSFGEAHASKDLGQLLINLEYDRIQAKLYASEQGSAQERDRMAQTAEARARSIARFARMLSKVTGRNVDIVFRVGAHQPKLLFDGDDIPLDMLGEGLRNTVSWLGDLFVRLERTRWSSPEISPFEQEFWLILDEIEESLHPTMQARILPALRELFPNARIYATTHSPFVVASAAEGIVFPIRPDQDHKVRGKVEPRALIPGQSLEWVVTEIFQARSGFVDEISRDLLERHKLDIRKFQRSHDMDWETFFARRAALMRLNDEVRTIVAMQEVPIRREVDDRMVARDAVRERGAGA